MINLLIAVAILTSLFYLAFRFKIIAVCPICAGVVIIWAAGLSGIYTNQTWAEPMFVGLLMASSVGAMAEKYGTRMGLLWKVSVVLAGLPAVYYLIGRDLQIGLPLGILTAFLALWVFRSRKPKVSKEDMFDNCC